MVSNINQLFSSHEILVYGGSFGIGFMWISFFGLGVRAFWRYLVKNWAFTSGKICPFFDAFRFFGKNANFVGLWRPNHLTYIALWGIKRNIISIYFIWYLKCQFLTTGTGTERLREKVTWSCEPQKVDISPVLSYSTIRHMQLNEKQFSASS